MDEYLTIRDVYANLSDGIDGDLEVSLFTTEDMKEDETAVLVPVVISKGEQFTQAYLTLWVHVDKPFISASGAEKIVETAREISDNARSIIEGEGDLSHLDTPEAPENPEDN